MEESIIFVEVKVVAVEYLNTRPFIYGIESSSHLPLREGLLLATPAGCAGLFAGGGADIALVPVGALVVGDLDCLVTNYCISATGFVDTVALLGDTPLSAISTIYLDAHSRTSVRLVQVLAREFWGLDVRYVAGLPLGRLAYGEAMVAIGDKVFELELGYSEKVDLAEQWQRHTGLPFVFAVWVSRTDRGRAMAGVLDEALRYGVENVARCLVRDEHYERNLRYLTQSIEFELSSQKREAMELFLSKIEQ